MPHSPRALVFAIVAALASILAPAAHAQVEPAGGVQAEDLVDSPADAAEDGGEAEAARAYAEGDLPRAIAIYRELGATHPELAVRTRMLVTAAWLLFELGDRSAAGEELRAALYREPDHVARQDLYSPEFLALLEDARAEAAIARTRAANRLLQEGIGRAKSGDAGAARAALEESLALVPRQPRAVHALAALDLAAGRTDEALAGFQKVLALDRGSPELVSRELEAQTLNNIGVIFYGRNQFEDAAESLERAAALAPRDARAWFNLGLARLALGRKIDGSRALERAHELDRGDAEISLHLAQAYREAASWIEGVALLVEATAAHPQDPALALELGWAQRGLGNRAGMMASLARAIELDPGNRRGVALPAALARAESELAAGAPALAAGDAVRATELAPDDPAGWALLGLIRKAEGRLPEAAQALERAAALAPGRADLAHNLGTVYLAQKRLVEADQAFRRALVLDPGFTESSAALARLEKARSAATPTKGGRKAAPRELGAEVAAVDYAPLGIRGLLVRSVAAGGLAERSGLLVDDLVLRADGKALTQVQTLTALVRGAGRRPITLSLLRAGKPVEVRLPPD